MTCMTGWLLVCNQATISPAVSCATTRTRPSIAARRSRNHGSRQFTEGSEEEALNRRKQRDEAATTMHANSQKEAKRRLEQKETKEAKIMF